MSAGLGHAHAETGEEEDEDIDGETGEELTIRPKTKVAQATMGGRR